MKKFCKLLTLSVVLTLVVNLHAVESSVEFKPRTDAQIPTPINSGGGTIYADAKQIKVKYSDGAVTNISQSLDDNATAISTHEADTANPHSVTKAQVGLGNVDDTADADKPVSTATQTALNTKEDTITNGAAASGSAAGQIPIWNATSSLWVPGLITAGSNITLTFTDGGITIAATDTTGMTNPMTTAGDIIIGGASGTPARLGIGTDGQVLTLSGGVPVWADATGGGGGLTYTVITSDTTATSGNFYIIDASSNTVTLTFPASPAVDNKIGYYVRDATNTVTIARNGNNIKGEAADLTPIAGTSETLSWSGNSTTGWFTANDATQTVDDIEFISTDLSSGILTVTGTKTIASIVNNSGAVVIPDQITYGSSNTTVDLSSFTVTGTWLVKFAQGVGSSASGGSSGGSSGLSFVWVANSFPQDFVLSDWTNITAFPPPDYDTFKYATFSVDYNSAEGMGVFCFGPIPADMTNLVVTIVAAPLSSGATGTTMDWKADIVRMRPGTADTSPTAYTLGSTTFETTGVTTGTYTVSLSTISATAGDVLQIVIYPDTGAAAPKQTDRLVSLVKIGVE